MPPTSPPAPNTCSTIDSGNQPPAPPPQSRTSTPDTVSATHSSNAAANTLTRPLTIRANDVHVEVQVPSYQDGWLASQLLREGFESSYKKQIQGVAASASAGSDVEKKEQQTTSATLPSRANPAHISLTAAFLGFAARKANEHAQDRPLLDCVQAIWTFFRIEYLTTTTRSSQSTQHSKPFTASPKHGTKTEIDIHSIATNAADFDEQARTSLLRDYYTAYVTLEKGGKEPQLPTPKLFQLASQGKAGLFALFGGQGTNEVHFNELQLLFDTYRPLVEPVLKVATRKLQHLVEQATVEGYSSFYLPGLNVYSWLTGSQPRPSTAYLGSIPVSLPLIGLTQLSRYLVSLRVSGLSARQFRDRFQGATGHSQGIVSAVVMAASDSLSSFESNVIKGLELLFHIGKCGQEAFPTFSIELAVIGDIMTGSEGVPTTVLAVEGLSEEALNMYVGNVNSVLAPEDHIVVSQHNGTHHRVVTGQPRVLSSLVRRIWNGTQIDQLPISSDQPRLLPTMRFLPVSSPFHSPHLEGVSNQIAEDCYGEEGYTKLWSVEDLAIEVRDTYDGSDLRTHAEEGILSSILRQIFDQPVHWSKATDVPSFITHCVDFGTGGLFGTDGLTASSLQSRGVRVIVAKFPNHEAAELYDSQRIKVEEGWTSAFSPKLVKTEDGVLRIDTRFTRLLGRAPIMVPKRTPSPVGAGLNAGFHIELADGGHCNAKALRAKMAEIQAATKPGQGFTLNALFINPRPGAIQLPTRQEMRRESLPLQGFCLAAGIPSTDNAKEIIAGLRSAGIEHVAFKPASADAIRQVCIIAAANPDFPVILQWTVGRAGGHHSAEDSHAPILATYGRIRQQSNIVLVAGSGFGSADDFWPYLSGDWSVKKFGLEPMPFDGVLSRGWVMIAKEAHASTAVKQLIVDAPGVKDASWEGVYEKETGGIITVTSELGEPIHKIATRGIKLWADLDKKLFSLASKDKKLAWLAEHRDWLIGKLNADFQKPWFPAHLDGTVANNVADLTYEEVTRRMLRLLFDAHQSRWIDPSLQRLMGDWLRRVEERFAGIESAGRKLSMLQSYSILDKEPAAFLGNFFAEYVDATKILLAAEDVSFFLALCQRPGQKPVPFIPVLCDNFQTWFEKDSFWQAEDIDAVFNSDPQRVCKIQTLMAAQHATDVDEPIEDMLGDDGQRLIQLCLERFYEGDASKVPSAQSLGPEVTIRVAYEKGADMVDDGMEEVMEVDGVWSDEVELALSEDEVELALSEDEVELNLSGDEIELATDNEERNESELSWLPAFLLARDATDITEDDLVASAKAPTNKAALLDLIAADNNAVSPAALKVAEKVRDGSLTGSDSDLANLADAATSKSGGVYGVFFFALTDARLVGAYVGQTQYRAGFRHRIQKHQRNANGAMKNMDLYTDHHGWRDPNVRVVTKILADFGQFTPGTPHSPQVDRLEAALISRMGILAPAHSAWRNRVRAMWEAYFRKNFARIPATEAHLWPLLHNVHLTGFNKETGCEAHAWRQAGSTFRDAAGRGVLLAVTNNNGVRTVQMNGFHLGSCYLVPDFQKAAPTAPTSR
ncbi:fatty acid synthase alpha subunit Lsd1 [Tilletia horrida]|nr:fatty acid synthase alpha subunit Lsd1 [Tilletia horrida]